MTDASELLVEYAALFEYVETADVVDRSLLDPLYQVLPARFPPIYEELILRYRWVEVELKEYRLLDNPPGTDLTGLLAEMRRDKGLWEFLLPHGYIQFGRGPDVNYDPVCFHINGKRRYGYRIVQLDHEEILCYQRLRVVRTLANNFVELVMASINYAKL